MVSTQIDGVLKQVVHLMEKQVFNIHICKGQETVCRNPFSPEKDKQSLIL